MVAVLERNEVKQVDVEILDTGNWTLFADAYADGKLKFKSFEWIIVEGKEKDALALFMDITNVDPKKVTCTCCGQHYSIREHDSVFQATAFERGCRFDKTLECFVEEVSDFPIIHYTNVEDFIERDNVLIIFADGSMNKVIF